jgi:hypothetical protein
MVLRAEGMRSPSVCIIALAVAVILLSQPVAALPIMTIPYARAGPYFHLNASEAADLFILEVNMSHLAADDSEALAISFMPAGNTGGPFFAPAIAQTSSRSIACDQTYFFRDVSIP